MLDPVVDFGIGFALHLQCYAKIHYGVDFILEGSIMERQFNKERPRKGFFNKSKFMAIINYLRETKDELKHVSWPTRRQSIMFSVIVVIVSVLTALFLGLFDFIFSRLLNLIV